MGEEIWPAKVCKQREKVCFSLFERLKHGFVRIIELKYYVAMSLVGIAIH